MRLLFLIGSLLAGSAAAPLAAQAPSGGGDRDPVTMAALNRMGAALRARTTIGVHVDITTENVLMTGQKIQFGGSIDVLASRPDKLKMLMKVGQSERQAFYDGKKLTLYAPQPNYYAVFAAPPNIRQTLQVAADQYGIEIPLADMFFWGDDPQLEARVQSAFAVGSEVINGQRCDHHAVRQELVDWQIWIRQSEEALPCKLVITNTIDSAMPQYTAVYSWLASPVIDPASFDFKAPEGASPIIFGPVRNSSIGK